MWLQGGKFVLIAKLNYNEWLEMKKCNLNCESQHEGYCCFNDLYPDVDFNPEDCDAKTDDDLITQEEFECKLLIREK